MRRAAWFPHGVGPLEEYMGRPRSATIERPAGGHFHPSQLEGLTLSIPAEVTMLGNRPTVVRILADGRRVDDIDIAQAQIEAEFALAVERNTYGFKLPPAPGIA